MGKEIMTKDNIVLNAKFSNKWAAIQACGDILVKHGYVSKEYINDMTERERLATVYIGNYVAIPHGISDSEKNIITSGMSFLQIPDGVDFGHEKAYIMVGIAGKDGSHIEMLSNIANVCMDLNNVEKLRTTSDKNEILRLFTKIEEEYDCKSDE